MRLQGDLCGVEGETKEGYLRGDWKSAERSF
jgi:hypothetical protein